MVLFFKKEQKESCFFLEEEQAKRLFFCAQLGAGCGYRPRHPWRNAVANRRLCLTPYEEKELAKALIKGEEGGVSKRRVPKILQRFPTLLNRMSGRKALFVLTSIFIRRVNPYGRMML